MPLLCVSRARTTIHPTNPAPPALAQAGPSPLQRCKDYASKMAAVVLMRNMNLDITDTQLRYTQLGEPGPWCADTPPHSRDAIQVREARGGALPLRLPLPTALCGATPRAASAYHPVFVLRAGMQPQPHTLDPHARGGLVQRALWSAPCCSDQQRAACLSAAPRCGSGGANTVRSSCAQVEQAPQRSHLPHRPPTPPGHHPQHHNSAGGGGQHARHRRSHARK